MKIRTDYVTNSSSSSFIMKDKNMKPIIKAFEAKKGDIDDDEWEDYDSLKYLLNGIHFERFREWDEYNLCEVLEWYSEELLTDMVDGISEVLNYCGWEKDCYKNRKEFLDNIDKIELSDDKLKRIALMYIAFYLRDMYVDRYSMLYVKSKGEDTVRFVYDRWIDELPLYIAESRRSFFDEKVIQEIFNINYERAIKLVKEYDGICFGDLLEVVFGGEYIYFDDYETHYIIGDSIKESGNCLYGCCHMG